MDNTYYSALKVVDVCIGGFREAAAFFLMNETVSFELGFSIGVVQNDTCG